MIKQLLSLISVGIFSLAFMSPPPYLENINNISNKNLSSILDTSDSKWISSIKESSSTTIPKLIFTRYATLAYQQAMLVTEYMLLSNTNRTSNDDVLFFYNDAEYDKNTWGSSEWEEKYTKKENTSDDWSFKLVNNVSKIDSSLGDINYDQYPNENVTNSILNYYINIKKDANIKFDIWIVDSGLEDLFRSNGSVYEFMKHVNKVYVISDGNYQPYIFLKNAINRYKESNYEQLSQDQIENKFRDYRNDSDNSLKEDFKNHKLYDFINDEKLFTFFHTNPYTNSEYYKEIYNLKNIELYKTYKMNYNYYDLATKLFNENTKESKNNIEAYFEDYEKFFKIYNFNNLSDFIWKNSSKYNPKKKNLIWLGDSLIKDKTHAYPERLKEERNIMQSWLKMFPTRDYNFFAKNHPSYSQDPETEWTTNIPNTVYGQVQLSNLIINNEEQASNVIYFQQVPWEIFISWDYKQQKTNSDYVPIFNSNPTKNNTVFVGFQYTTTSIQTTAFFLEDAYGYDLEQVNETLNSYYFPIPETFDVVARTTESSFSKEDYLKGNYAKTNIQKIEEIYDPFVLLDTFPEYKNSQILASDFIKKNYDPNYSVYDSEDSNNSDSKNNVIIISISITIIAILIIISTIFILYKYKKK